MARRRTADAAGVTKTEKSSASSRIVEALMVAVITAALVGSTEPWWLQMLRSYLGRAEPDLDRYCTMKYGPGFRLRAGSMAGDWVCLGPDDEQMAISVSEACIQQFNTPNAYYVGERWLCEREGGAL
jgi:hypothetical protein